MGKTELERIKTLDEIDLEYRNAALLEGDISGNSRDYNKDARNKFATSAIFYAALAIVVFVLLSFFSDNNGVPRSFMGFSMMHVLTTSMQSEIPKDSLVITREVDAASLDVGDDITFMKDMSTTVTHRIVGIYEDYAKTGARGFKTQGIANSNPDKEIVPAQNLIGKVVFHNLLLGKAMLFIKEYALYVVIFTAMLIGLFVSLRIVFSKGHTGSRASPHRLAAAGKAGIQRA